MQVIIIKLSAATGCQQQIKCKSFWENRPTVGFSQCERKRGRMGSPTPGVRLRQSPKAPPPPLAPPS